MNRRTFLKTISGIFLFSLLEQGCTRKETKEPDTPRKPEARKGSTPAKSRKDLVVVTGDSIEKNLEVALRQLGGIERFVSAGDRVLLKPNLVTGRKPEYAVNTNPLLVAAIVKICREAGAKEVVVTDRPTTDARTAFEVSGMADAVKKAGGKLKYPLDSDFVEVEVENGYKLNRVLVLKDVLEADVFINLPIAKHHSLAGLTLSIKNLMGVLGGTRGFFHIDFHEKIVDLLSVVMPDLNILDAWRILIRNGPTGGSLDDVEEKKTIIAGTDPVAVDSAAALALFNKDPEELPYLKFAEQKGIGKIQKWSD